jgi:hypothetical protein
MGGACGTHGGEEKCIEIMVVNLPEKHQLRHTDVNRKIIVQASNDPSGSVKCGEFVDQLRNC